MTKTERAKATAPRQTEEALLVAALDCARHWGITKVNIKRVAEQAGVTRQTVYRYFPSSEALVEAVSWRVVSDIMQQLDQRLESVSGFDNKLIESIVFLAETIPGDPYLSQYFSASGVYAQNAEELFADTTLHYCYEYIKTLYGRENISAEEQQWLKALVEHVLHTVLVMVVIPCASTKSQQGKRQYLNNWLRPVLIMQ